ncbi:DsbD family 2 [Leptospira inadai serovar Lyme str. 10]|uniref:DsbD family 2 n=2 Tax=Leptospira inadai serovar Lyme TaxID=293084 RepID=V6HTU0_9LEPT|nr:sulfite exporter TauE/SafE family protein [Leptospira inadai]EQA36139.1 DsbD family 2 [Leptospira inadai serovar Lyme str. 10]PNV74900.1 sulfite exporter TauE/SafE family protein [Leptospira inadai serovar Lyme]
MILPILGAAFLHGLTSSLHCVGMCGPFAGTLSLSSGQGSRKENAFLQLCYNLGRLGSYSLIGTLLGFVGQGANLVSTELGFIREIAAWISGIFVILFGLSLLLGGGASFASAFAGRILGKVAGPILEALRKNSDKPFRLGFIGFNFGLVTGLLPCGVLYPAFALAFATGSPWTGGAVMASFFIGTFPLLFAFGYGFRSLALRLKGNAARFAGTLVILVGIGWIFLRFGHDHSEHTGQKSTHSESHSHHEP